METKTTRRTLEVRIAEMAALPCATVDPNELYATYNEQINHCARHVISRRELPSHIDRREFVAELESQAWVRILEVNQTHGLPVDSSDRAKWVTEFAYLEIDRYLRAERAFVASCVTLEDAGFEDKPRRTGDRAA